LLHVNNVTHNFTEQAPNLEHDITEELPETVVAEDGFVVGETANVAFTVTTEESFTNSHHDVVQPLPASEVQGVDVSVGSSIGSSPAISGNKIVPAPGYSIFKTRWATCTSHSVAVYFL